MKKILCVLFVIYSMYAQAQVQPHPICSQADYTRYLEDQKREAEVLFVIKNCPNVVLDPLHPLEDNNFLLVRSVAKYNWKEVFEKIKNREDVRFHGGSIPWSGSNGRQSILGYMLFYRPEFLIEILKTRTDIELGNLLWLLLDYDQTQVMLDALRMLLAHPKFDPSENSDRLIQAMRDVARSGKLDFFDVIESFATGLSQDYRPHLWAAACWNKDTLLKLIKKKSYDINGPCYQVSREHVVAIVAHINNWEIVEELLAQPNISFNSIADGHMNSFFEGILELNEQQVTAILNHQNFNIRGKVTLMFKAWAKKGLDNKKIGLILGARGFEFGAESADVLSLIENIQFSPSALSIILGHPSFDYKDKASDGRSILHLAPRMGHFEKIFLVMLPDILTLDINENDPSTNLTPLLSAIAVRNTEMIRSLMGQPKLDIDKVAMVSLRDISKDLPPEKFEVSAVLSVLLQPEGLKPYFPFDLHYYSCTRRITGDINGTKFLSRILKRNQSIYYTSGQYARGIPSDHRIRCFLDQPGIKVGEAEIRSLLELAISEHVSSDLMYGLRELLKLLRAQPSFNVNWKNFSLTRIIEGKYDCSALGAAVKFGDLQIVKEILGTENVAGGCNRDSVLTVALKTSGKEYSIANEVLEALIKDGRFPIDEPHRNFSNYILALERGLLRTAELMVANGYTQEINSEITTGNRNGHERLTLLGLAIKDDEISIVETLLKASEFDPNEAGDGPSSAAFKAIEAKRSAIFDLLISDPRFDLGTAIGDVFGYWNGRVIDIPDSYYERMVDKFVIRSPEDQEKIYYALLAYIKRDKILEHPFARAMFLKLVTKKSYDINFIPKNETKTLLSHSMFRHNRLLVEEFLKFKNLDLSKGEPPLHSYFLSPRDDSFETESDQKMLGAYLADPRAPKTIPAWEGKSLYVRMNEIEFSDYRLYLFLSIKNYSFSKQDINLLTNRLISNRLSSEGLLELIFSHPSLQPVSQWTSLVFENVFQRDYSATFMIKWASKFDLTYIPKSGGGILSIIRSNYTDEVFETYAQFKNVSVGGDLLEYYTAEEVNLEEFAKLLERHGKKFSTESILEIICDIKASGALELLIPYLKSFNGLSEAYNYRADTLFNFVQKLMSHPNKSYAVRFIKEDKGFKSYASILSSAIENSRKDVVSLMLARGLNLNEFKIEAAVNGTEYILNAVGVAVMARSIPMMDYLLVNGSPLENEYGGSALSVALLSDWLKGAEWLIEKGASVNYGYGVFNPLHISINRKNLVAIELLLSAGAALDRGALVYATITDDLEIFEKILENCEGEVNSEAWIEGVMTFALIEATRMNRIEFVRALLSSRKINKSVKDSNGRSALDWAYTLGHKEIVKLLTEQIDL